MPDHIYAAVDLGGTKTYTVLSDEKGEILAADRQKTNAHAGPDAVIRQMIRSIRQLTLRAGCETEKLYRAGVCVPGFFDLRNNVVINLPNLSGWSNVPLASLMAEELKAPVIVENDANAAALGEALSGAGSSEGYVAYLTVSTGIGAGFVHNGKIFHGSRGFAGEAGHMVVRENGLLCGCGRRGCLETVSSGTAIAKAAATAMKSQPQSVLWDLAEGRADQIDAPLVFQAAKIGDSAARLVLDEAIYYLGVGIINIINLLNPDTVVIGGGVAEAGDMLFEPLRKMVAEQAIAPAAGMVEIKKAALGAEAGVRGLLCLLLQS